MERIGERSGDQVERRYADERGDFLPVQSAELGQSGQHRPRCDWANFRYRPKEILLFAPGRATTTTVAGY